ncbi:MAG: hypothetical protein ACREGC_00960, partial [Minisyncoccia bacterium]
ILFCIIHLMKFIRIFLLVLIIIGLILLATQKIWVPKLVNLIISSENSPVIEEVVQPNIILTDGRQCYTYNHEATPDAPYTVNEFMDMTITGKIVTGTKRGTQNGPDMTNGYNGTISGTLQNNVITDLFSYTVEGSQNKEKEIYRTNKVGIEKLRYPLVEENGVLVPDTTKEFQALTYARVGCTASD